MWMLPFADDSTPPEQVEVLDEAIDEELDESVGDEVSKTLLVMLPWSISILFHLAIILLAFFLGWVIVQQEEPDEITIAAPTINPMPPMPVNERIAERKPEQRVRTPAKAPTKPKVQTEVVLDMPTLVAVTAPSATAPAITNSPGGEDFLGVPSSGGGAPPPSRIAFVIDASGSLIDTFPFIIDELKRFVNSLEASQSFTILFYTGDEVIEVPPGKLRKANSEHKQRVINWIDIDSYNVIPRGSGDPIRAIRQALSYRPQLIYLLSDNITGRGAYSINQQTLLNAIRQANRSNTKITTIQFIYEDPLALAPDKEGKPAGPDARTLKKIADMTEGFHEFVPASELNIH